MTTEGVVRTAIAFNLSRQSLYGDVAVFLETYVLTHSSKFDHFQSAQLIYSFS